ncbi:hypothetical protein ATANTOWER_031328 [Ataeniobius toweri]|uniref:Uncharacterized protein n=1 Tax=Ataeniobius toweri TaxID=208326 RepID=A0ABU7CK07_9TELE|nr:hypothetical protein [Ataeniobius toweri]
MSMPPKNTLQQHCQTLTSTTTWSIYTFPAGRWQPATVMQPAGTPRSYHIKTNDRQIFRRNRRHLLTTQDKPPTPAIQQTENNKPNTNPEEEKPAMQQLHCNPVREMKLAELELQKRCGRVIKPRQILDL